MAIRKYKMQILAVLLVLVLLPAFALAEEKKGTVESYAKGKVVFSSKDGSKTPAKISRENSKAWKNLLEAGTKVLYELEGKGDEATVKSLSGR
ncbi:MAG: hypothetical protein Q8P24_09575 [Desulfobacterales bacterium]|nr:hypothetical protein [Desulfobacterales bacterium]